MRNFYSMNFNLRMTVERSKRRSYFLSLVFITKCFSKNLLLRFVFFSCFLFYYVRGLTFTENSGIDNILRANVSYPTPKHWEERNF